jgi:hypothetical protein
MSLSFSQSLNAHAPPFVELFICWFCARRPRNSPSIPSSQAIPLSAQANIICDRKRLNAYRPDGFVASGVTSVIVPKKPIIISSQV